MKKDEDSFTVKYTNKDIMDKLDALDQKIDSKFLTVSSISKKAMATAALAAGMLVLVLGFLFSHLSK